MRLLESYLGRGAAELEITLTAEQLEKFKLFAVELCKWNRKINLTSIVLPEEIAIKHFVDSLMLTKYVEVAGRILDIGSGGGFPCIPLKIVFPETEIVSVDAVEKKILFQRHVARLLGLAGFRALHCRVENLSPEYKGIFNRIVSRAFSDLPEFVRNALPYLAEDGVIVAMKGRDGKKEAEKAAEELTGMGAAILTVHELKLPILEDARSLIMIRRK